MTVEEIIEETIEQPQAHSDEASLSVTTNSDQASKRKMIPESDKEKSKRPRYETKSSQKETILDDECQIIWHTRMVKSTANPVKKEESEDECEVLCDTRYRKIYVSAGSQVQKPTEANSSANQLVAEIKKEVEVDHEPTDSISRSPIQSEKRKMVGASRKPQSKVENQDSKLESESGELAEKDAPQFSTKSPPAISEEDYEKEEVERRRQKQSMATSASIEPSFTYEDEDDAYEEENFSSMSFSGNDENTQTQWTNPAKRRLVFKDDQKKSSSANNNANWEEVSNSLVWKCMMGWLEQGNKAYREKYNVRVPYNYIKSNANSSNANSSNGNSSKTTNIINKNNSQNNSSNVSEPNNSNITENEEDEVTILYYSKDSQ